MAAETDASGAKETSGSMPQALGGMPNASGRAAQEQAVSAAIRNAAVYQFPEIDGYTPYDDPQADQDLIARDPWSFFRVGSPQECRVIEQRLRRHESDAKLLCGTGLMGAIAAAASGRPALATWNPARTEFVDGELKYQPGHATLSYGFPDISLVQTGTEDSERDGDGDGSGAEEDAKEPFYEGYYTTPGEARPTQKLIIRPRRAQLPERDGPDGYGKSDVTPNGYRVGREEKNARLAADSDPEPVAAPISDQEIGPDRAPSQIEPPNDALPQQPAANPFRRLAIDPSAPTGPETSPQSGDGLPDVGETRAALSQRPAGEAPIDSAAPPSSGADAEQAPIAEAKPQRPWRSDEQAPAKQNAKDLSWIERFKLSQHAAEYGSVEGAVRLYKLATVAKWLEEHPNASDKELLTQFAPAVLKMRWVERRQVTIDYLRNAAQLLEEVRHKNAEYEATEFSGSFGDFTAWLFGQATGGWKSLETYTGGSSKVASLLGRALISGLKQAGIAAGADAVAQWLLVKAGLQKEVDPVQSLAAGAATFVVGAGAKAGADSVKLGISAKSGGPDATTPAATKHGAPDVEAPSQPRSGAPEGEVSAPAKSTAPDGEVPIAEKAVASESEVPTAAAKPRELDSKAPEAATPAEGLVTTPDPGPKKKLTVKERRAAESAARIENVEREALKKPVSKEYQKASVGENGKSDYAETFYRVNENLRDGKVEVHHAVERRVLKRFPGLFTPQQLNSLENLRGIQNNSMGNDLHRRAIRKEWDGFYKQFKNKMPTREEVLDHATRIDRKFGGLFDPPL